MPWYFWNLAHPDRLSTIDRSRTHSKSTFDTSEVEATSLSVRQRIMRNVEHIGYRTRLGDYASIMFLQTKQLPPPHRARLKIIWQLDVPLLSCAHHIITPMSKLLTHPVSFSERIGGYPTDSWSDYWPCVSPPRCLTTGCGCRCRSFCRCWICRRSCRLCRCVRCHRGKPRSGCYTGGDESAGSSDGW